MQYDFPYIKMVFQRNAEDVAYLELASRSKLNFNEPIEPVYPITESRYVIKADTTDEVDNECPIQINNGMMPGLPQILLLEETDYEVKLEYLEHISSDYSEDDLKNGALRTLREEGRRSNTLTLNTLLLEKEDRIIRGTLRFNSYVGKSFFDIVLSDWNGRIPFEVRSKKIDYLKHYPKMLEDIASVSSYAVLDSDTPLYEEYSALDKDSDTFYEDYLLLEHIMSCDNFPSFYQQMKKNMVSRLIPAFERVPLSATRIIDLEALTDVLTSPWLEIKNGGPIANLYDVPDIIQTDYIDTVDIPENRLIKDFITSIDALIEELLDIRGSDDDYISDRLKEMKKCIRECMSDSWLSEVGDLVSIPYNSTILQRKSGYREIFHAYLVLKSGISVSLDDTAELLKGHNKKVHELYEYWCYIKLFETLKELSVKPPALTIKKSGKKWNIPLEHETVEFVPRLNEDVKIELYFQNKYSRDGLDMRSYSLFFKPDCSMKFSIRGRKDFMIVHFDAKYKSIVIEKHEENEDRGSKYKSEDLNKMHTYRDGILQTGGAFILYPGDEDKHYAKHNDKEFPIVGAIRLRPGEIGDLESLKSQIEELIIWFISFSTKTSGELIIS